MKALVLLGFFGLFFGTRAIVRTLERRRREASFNRAIWPERTK